MTIDEARAYYEAVNDDVRAFIEGAASRVFALRIAETTPVTLEERGTDYAATAFLAAVALALVIFGPPE